MNHTLMLSRFGVLLVQAVVLAFTLWIYYPGVNGPSLLDDHSSLIGLNELKDSPELALDSVLGDRSGPFGRKVTMATFVAETLIGEGGVETTKLVNIGLHLLNGVCLAWLLTLLLSPLSVPHYRLAAVVFASIWLLSPLHVSTVLYAVQRMAIMAMLFAQSSLIFYVYWRRSMILGRAGYFWLFLAVTSMVLGVLAKENALVALPLALLLEMCWFQYSYGSSSMSPSMKRVMQALVCSGALLIIVLLFVFWGDLASHYEFREFSLKERLLTQTRILWDYVFQFYFPSIERMGIYHDDFLLSTSPSSPTSTAWSLIGWTLVLVFCALFWRAPWGRRLACGPLIFLAAHSLESTVWPLELYFEHRNYLPSLGLILLPMAAFSYASTRWKESAPPLLVWLAILSIYFATLTSSQARIWSNGTMLAMQSVNAHPESARANRELAKRFAIVGGREQALYYSGAAYFSALKHPAAGDEHHGDYVLRDLALACIAHRPLEQHEYRELGRYDPERPLGEVVTMSVVVKLRQSGACDDFDWDGFDDHLARLFLQDFDTSKASANMFVALAMLSNAGERWDQAYAYMERALVLAPDNIRNMLMQLHFSVALGKLDEAREWITHLQDLESDGKLNRREKDTLSLYLEIGK